MSDDWRHFYRPSNVYDLNINPEPCSAQHTSIVDVWDDLNTGEVITEAIRDSENPLAGYEHPDLENDDAEQLTEPLTSDVEADDDLNTSFQEFTLSEK